jgi:hypothetical protein
MKNENNLTSSEVGQIIDRIVSKSNTSDDLDKIISYFYYARDLSSLGKLLDSEDDDIIGDAIYILSEIGKSGTPLREKAKTFLNHPDVQIRYWAMNSVVSCYERKSAKDLVVSAGLLNDPDEFVRTRAHEMISVGMGRQFQGRDT